MKIDSFYKGQEFLYHCPSGITHKGVVNFIDDVGALYITLTVGKSNLVIYPQWWYRLEEVASDPVPVPELVESA